MVSATLADKIRKRETDCEHRREKHLLAAVNPGIIVSLFGLGRFVERITHSKRMAARRADATPPAQTVSILTDELMDELRFL